MLSLLDISNKLKSILPNLTEKKSLLCDEPQYTRETIKEILLATENIENNQISIGILHIDLAKTFLKHVWTTHDKLSSIAQELHFCMTELKKIKKSLIHICTEKSKILC